MFSAPAFWMYWRANTAFNSSVVKGLGKAAGNKVGRVWLPWRFENQGGGKIVCFWTESQIIYVKYEKLGNKNVIWLKYQKKNLSFDQLMDLSCV